MEIYLDFNIYLSLLKKEINNVINYEYVLAKITTINRNSPTIKFPYSPAHMEEIAVNLQRNVNAKNLISQRLKLISRYSKNYEFLPGAPTLSQINEDLEEIPNIPELYETRRILDNIRKQYVLGTLKENPKTQRVVEPTINCFQRVVGDLEATDWAHKNDVYIMGRRNEKSIKKNFSFIDTNSDTIQTFEELHKKAKLGPKRLSQLKPFEVFNNNSVKAEFSKTLKENKIDTVLTGKNLLNNHSNTESIVTVVLNFLEKIGYNQEENNNTVKLRSRMHDVSHAIYGAQADYLVTNDVRFRLKLQATYCFLKIPCVVLSPDEFVKKSFKSELSPVIYV